MAGRGSHREGNGFDDWGGYMSAKISKLQDQFQQDAEKDGTKESDLFKGISVFVNGYTNPSSEELKRLMIRYGGTFHHYQTRETTHIIASNLPEAKIKQLKGSEKIIKPDWVVQCIKAGKILDYKPFLLIIPNPKNQLGFQPVRATSNPSPLPNPSPQKLDRPSSASGCNSPSPQKEETATTSTFLSSNESVSSRRTFKTGDTNFIAEYYNRSRLHHISTMGALFKRHITDLRSQHDPLAPFPGLQDLREWKKQHSSELNDSVSCPVDQKQERVVMHIDMDCFFVSVGLRKHPELRNLPVAVTHAKSGAKPGTRGGTDRQYEFQHYKEKLVKTWEEKHGGGGDGMKKLTGYEEFKTEKETEVDEPNVDEYFPRLENIDETCSMSEIASCNYLAREAGIQNGMFMGAALKLCPNLKTIPYDFEAYKDVSYALYDIVARYTLEIEAVSCDEMFLDITQVLRETSSSPLEFASHLRTVIQEKTGCAASAGMGPSQLIARLTTKKAKPNGQFWVRSSEISPFMLSQKVEDLPGVGRSLAYRLAGLNVKTCADMQKLSLGQLQQEVGPKVGQTLFSHCRGQDHRPLQTDHVRKSVSAEVNYGIRLANDQEAYKFVSDLAGEVAQRLEDNRVRGKSLTLKLMVRAKGAPVETAKFMGHGVCDSFSKSVMLGTPTRDVHILQREVLALLRQLKPEPSDIRGVGIQVSKLETEIAKAQVARKAVANVGRQSLLNFVKKEDLEGKGFKEEKTEELVAEASTSTNVITAASATKVGVQKNLFKNPFEAAKRKRASPTPPLEPNVALPSATQLDWQVWSELPPEIRADLEAEYHRQGLQLPSNKMGVSTAADTRTKIPEASITTREENTGTRVLETIQVDPDFLAALPPDVREEVERDLSRQQGQQPNNKMVRAASGSASTSTSPLKGPNRCRPLSRVKKTTGKKRGRSEMETVRKTKHSTGGISNESKTAIMPVAASPIKVPCNNSSCDVSPAASTSSVQSNLRKPSLCGASTLPEIRSLLQQWLTSTTTEPVAEDVQIVSQFLIELVHQPNLELLVQVIQTLRRLVMKAEHPDWRTTSERVLQLVQEAVIKRYGSPLFLEPVV